VAVRHVIFVLALPLAGCVRPVDMDPSRTEVTARVECRAGAAAADFARAGVAPDLARRFERVLRLASTIELRAADDPDLARDAVAISTELAAASEDLRAHGAADDRTVAGGAVLAACVVPAVRRALHTTADRLALHD
jgi:hypothetical protein